FVFREDYYMQAKQPKAPTANDEARVHDEHAKWLMEYEKVHGISELIVAKQRHGSTGKVRLHFEARTTKFSDLADESYRYDDSE
ncbi:MAG: DnaB-like helicase C-terminal domain-containing protein, partial [Sphingopyxis sp.]